MARAGFVVRLLQPCAVVVLLGFLAACGGGGDGGDGGEPVRTVTTVSVTSPSAAPKQGDTVQLTAVARDQLGVVMPSATATWSSSAPAVATVSSTGLLQALAGGSVTITATISGVSGTLALTITPRVTTTVAVSSPTASPAVGETVQLTVVARDQFGDAIAGRPATWSTSDARIATISAAGLLQALAPGAVTATASIDGVPGSLTLTVVPGTVASVTVNSPTLTPKEGDTVQLTADARDQYGNIVPGATATWSVSDATLAGVSTTGLLQTYATGTVQVRANVAGVTGAASLIISAIKVSVTVGAKEVVFDYTTDPCYYLDVPDQPTRFVRAEDGSLVLIDGNAPRHYLSRGADFNSLKRDCSQPALVSADRPTPESYENWEWLWVVYREGNRWHALLHNEFHDAASSTCRVGDPSPSNPCVYNSITYGVSTDGGRTFVKPPAPEHVVAPAPNAWVPPITPVPYGVAVEGYFSPMNIVKSDDGYYYSLAMVIPAQNGIQRLCVFRTATLGDPSSWRAWDGSGFNLRMTSPYLTGNPAPLCAAVLPYGAVGHIVYSTYLSRYVLINPSPGPLPVGDRWMCGFFFWLSPDLVHWSAPQLLAEARFAHCDTNPQAAGLLESVLVLYPAIVDHADTTINFERAGRNAYLYYTRFNDGGLDRDIVRVPITFNRVD